MTIIETLSEAYENLKAVSDAGVFGIESLQGGLELARRLASLDLHPSVIWALHAANLGDKPAFVQGERRLSWAEANQRINRFANGLRSLGIEPGDRVAYMLKNSVEWIEALAACQKIGASAVFVSYRYTAPEVEYLVQNSNARGLVFGTEFAEVVREAKKSLAVPAPNYVEVGGSGETEFRSYERLIESASAEEPSADLRKGGSRIIMYTSGTTGKPKGAVRDLAKASLASLVGLLRRVPFRRSDVHLVAAPLYHATGSGFATLHISLGATLHLMERFDPIEFLRIVARERITTTALVPTMLRSIVTLPEEERKKYDVSSLRIVVTTGSALPAGLQKIATDYLGEVIYDLYGSTEMGYVTVASPEDKRQCPGSVGKAIPGVEIVLLSEDRRPVADGQVGELFAKSELIVEGYHANEEATQKSRWGDFFSVGDLAVRDPRGYITLVDRKTDMVISGGMNIYPAEIEQVLITHPEILEAAVVGVPDEKWGEALVAFVAPREGQTITEDAIVEHCRSRLAGYKIPRRFRFVAELPRNPTGKVLKGELRAGLSQG